MWQRDHETNVYESFYQTAQTNVKKLVEPFFVITKQFIF